MKRGLVVIILLGAFVCSGRAMAQSTIEKTGKKVESGAKKTGDATVKGTKKVGKVTADKSKEAGKVTAEKSKEAGQQVGIETPLQHFGFVRSYSGS